jgi:hypothetical protein
MNATGYCGEWQSLGAGSVHRNRNTRQEQFNLIVKSSSMLARAAWEVDVLDQILMTKAWTYMSPRHCANSVVWTRREKSLDTISEIVRSNWCEMLTSQSVVTV